MASSIGPTGARLNWPCASRMASCPVDLLDGYDLDDFVTFTQHPDYDILDIHFGDLEAPDEWVDYELGSLIAMRDELMEGDLRALYIVWLAGQRMIEGYNEDGR